MGFGFTAAQVSGDGNLYISVLFPDGTSGAGQNIGYVRGATGSVGVTSFNGETGSVFFGWADLLQDNGGPAQGDGSQDNVIVWDDGAPDGRELDRGWYARSVYEIYRPYRARYTGAAGNGSFAPEPNSGMGVASFTASHFVVNNGAVSLSGSYAIIGVTSFNGQVGSVQDFYSLTGATSVAYPQGLSGTGFTGDDLLIATGAANDPFRQYVRYANHWFQTGVIGLPNGTFTAPVTAPGYQYSSSAFVSKTATFDISNSDRGKVFVMSNTTSGENIGILSGITKGFVADVLVVGDGWVELVPKSGVTLKWVEGRINPPNRIQIVAYDDNNLLATYIPV